MLKVSKLTDYGIGLMTCLARQRTVEPVTARGMAATMALPLPTVSKVLKLLSGAGLLVSTRGASGGYALANKPEQISLVQMLEVFEGPMSVTECSGDHGCSCEIEVTCGLKANWNWINGQLMNTLQGITLEHMAGSVANEVQTLTGNESVPRYE